MDVMVSSPVTNAINMASYNWNGTRIEYNPSEHALASIRQGAEEADMFVKNAIQDAPKGTFLRVMEGKTNDGRLGAFVGVQGHQGGFNVLNRTAKETVGDLIMYTANAIKDKSHELHALMRAAKAAFM